MYINCWSSKHKSVCYLQEKPTVQSKLLNHTKNRTHGTCLAIMAYVYAQLRSTCYYFQYGSIIPTGFKFTELHALTIANRSVNIPVMVRSGASVSGCVCPSVYIAMVSTVPLGPRVSWGGSFTPTSWTQARVELLKAPSLMKKETCLVLSLSARFW